jgi:sortase A
VTFVAGLALLAFYGAARLDGYLASRSAIASFEAVAAHSVSASSAKSTPAAAGSRSAKPMVAPNRVDFSDWAATRVRAYRRSLARDAGTPIAILRIPKIHLVAPVFDSTGSLALNRGLGWIAGTAMPGEPGNLAIAGHRDGFFRGLKDIRPGEAIEVESIRGTETYIVRKILIVSPRDVSVLAPRRGSTLTLVTCYPFYFIGNAPKRYVVEASLRGVATNPQSGQRPASFQQGAVQGEAKNE